MITIPMERDAHRFSGKDKFLFHNIVQPGLALLKF
jgi:hypothetical protein